MTDYNNYNPYAYRNNVYAFVNGIEGAKSFQIMPNQTVLLMDSDNPVCYMKTANAMGQATLRYFKLVEVSEQDLTVIPDNSPIAILTKKVDELYKLLEKKDEEVDAKSV